MSHVLHLVIARASGKMTTPQAADAAVAVLYQVCLTILSIYPNQDLIILVTRKIDGNSTEILCKISGEVKQNYISKGLKHFSSDKIVFEQSQQCFTISEFLNSASNKVYLGLQLLEKLCEKQPSIGAAFIPQGNIMMASLQRCRV